VRSEDAARSSGLQGEGSGEDRIAALFTREVAVIATDPAAPVHGLFPEEAAQVARAVPKRRQEFAAGRACAREALRRRGGPWIALPTAPDRSPIWPTGFVGSISHCDSFCCAVVASSIDVASLGVDVERATPLDTAVANLVCRPEELAAFERLGQAPQGGWSKVAFSAKESFYKAYVPVARTFLDFHDVALSFRPDAHFDQGRFTAKILNPARARLAPAGFEGAWIAFDGRIHTGVTLPRPG
jgi:4'-phosphopantetheinyl transferase EntD